MGALNPTLSTHLTMVIFYHQLFSIKKEIGSKSVFSYKTATVMSVTIYGPLSRCTFMWPFHSIFQAGSLIRHTNTEASCVVILLSKRIEGGFSGAFKCLRK